MRRRLVLVTATLALSVLAACSGREDPAPAASTAEGDELVALARQEGQIVWYTGNLQPSIDAVQKAFRDTYGIEVRVPERLSSAALAQRIDADVRSAGAIGADVITTSDVALADSLRAEEYTAPVSIATFPGVPPAFVRGDAGVGCSVVVPVVGYRTAGGLTIDSWDDLLDPRLSGRIMVNDPRNSAAWSQMFATLFDDPRLGEGYLRKLRAQDYQPVASSLVGVEQLVAGQGDVLLAGTPGQFAGVGRDVAAWYPTDPAPVTVSQCVLPSGSTHPNAAKLFLQWLMTPDGQAALNNADYLASPLEGVPGATVRLPANFVTAPPPARVQSELPRVLAALGFN